MNKTTKVRNHKQEARTWLICCLLRIIQRKHFPLSSLLAPRSLLLTIACLLLAACSSSPEKKQPVDSSVKFTQYYVQGEELYLQHCSNCHQKNGTGLGLLYPPLNRSDFMDNHPEEVICLMKYGIKGERTVNGKSFNKEMPAIPTLTDLEIAEIATYIYNTWEHQRGMIEVRHVSTTLENCKTN